MKHLGLFEGIGGFSLAARWAGWETIAWCEINEFGQKVLRHHFPEAEGFSDITKTDFTKYANKIDIITGGFPCQPYSTAGKRLGKEDARHLWPEMFRAIREVKPTFIVGENVRGLVNWNGGLVFDEVQSDLENEGYEVFPFLLPACAINAPHKRERIWFVAHSRSVRCDNEQERQEQTVFNEGRQFAIKKQSGNIEQCRIIKSNTFIANPSDTRIESLQRSAQNEEITSNATSGGRIQDNEKFSTKEFKRDALASDTLLQNKWRNGICKKSSEMPFRGRNTAPIGFDSFPTQSPVCSRNDGFSYRLDGITFPKWRSESIKAAGNAIVPQVAYQIFKAINSLSQTPTQTPL